MRAFRYRLAAVLTRAEHAERTLQIELARRQDELADLDGQLESLRKLQTELRARMREALSAGSDMVQTVDLGPLQSLQQAMEDAEALVAHVAQLRRGITEQIADTRQRLLEAARSRQVLENHRQDQAERHRRGELRAETKHLDELAANGPAREMPQAESSQDPSLRSG